MFCLKQCSSTRALLKQAFSRPTHVWRSAYCYTALSSWCWNATPPSPRPSFCPEPSLQTTSTCGRHRGSKSFPACHVSHHQEPPSPPPPHLLPGHYFLKTPHRVQTAGPSQNTITVSECGCQKDEVSPGGWDFAEGRAIEISSLGLWFHWGNLFLQQTEQRAACWQHCLSKTLGVIWCHGCQEQTACWWKTAACSKTKESQTQREK